MDAVYLFPWEHLHGVGRDVLKAGGCPDDEARGVCDGLLKANLVGHDSHGIIRLSQYMTMVREGAIKPGQRAGLLRDHGAVAVLTGYRGFGQTIATEAMTVAVARARTHQVAAVGVTDLGHIGRLTDYAVMAAHEGMIGMVFTSTGGYSKLVAPFGGAERRMSTNPMAVAFPSDREAPVVFDFASSAYAEGKFRVMHAGHVSAPPGVLIDKDGHPSTDPADLYAGGAILPLGGQQGYKGYLLNFMMEVLGGLLTGGGYVGKEEKQPFNNSSLMIVLNVPAFRDVPVFKAELEGLMAYLKATRTSSGGEVLYPGEKEVRTEAQRADRGIPLAADTVEKLQWEVDHYGLGYRLLDAGTPSQESAWTYG